MAKKTRRSKPFVYFYIVLKERVDIFTLFLWFQIMNLSIALTLLTTHVRFNEDPTSMNTSESPNMVALGSEKSCYALNEQTLL